MKVTVEFKTEDDNFDKVQQYENIKDIINIDDTVSLIENDGCDSCIVLETKDIKNMLCEFKEQTRC